VFAFDRVFGPLSALSTRFNVNSLKLSFQSGNLLHIALTQIFEAGAVNLGDRQFLNLDLMLASELIQSGLSLLQ